MVLPGTLLTPAAAIELVDEAMKNRERLAFATALDTQHQDAALKMAILRLKLVTEARDPVDGPDVVERGWATLLEARGYMAAPFSPAYKFGHARYREALKLAATRGLSWAAGDYQDLPAHVLAEPEPVGPTITQAMESYLGDVEMRGRQIDEVRSIVRQFVEVVGSDLPVTKITSAHCRSFKDAMKQKPARPARRGDRALTLPALIALYEGKTVERLAAKTIRKNLSIIQTVLAWAKRSRLIGDNPMEGLIPPKPKRAALIPNRLPFSDSDIKRIFSAPLFTGAKSDARLNDSGEHLVSDHRFWLPVLALYTGARLEELAQADAADVRQVDGIWVIDLTNLDETGKVAADKDLKNLSSRRKVPVHEALRNLGFIEYAVQAKTVGGKLFPDLSPNRHGEYGAAFSKFFSRFLKDCGFVDADERKDRLLTFHSFRHKFKDMARAAGVGVEVHDALTGHTRPGVGAQYGSGVPLKMLASAVECIACDGFPKVPRRE